jgi:D-glycero-alpha-D-manno-heptose-7-phosphate kinase
VIAHLLSAGEDSAELEDLRACAVMARDAVLAGDLEGLGRAMTRNTDAQRRLHGELVSAQAQAVIDFAAAQGASGWKINGAGGEGGSVTILCSPDPERRRDLERAVLAGDPALQIIPIRLSQDGLWARRS